MSKYDPLQAPESKWWLSLDEDQRIELAQRYHRRARVKLPNALAHAAFHAIVETQVAAGDELPAARTLARLQAEGLDRHEAVHAIATVMAEHMHDVMSGKVTKVTNEDPHQPYWRALEKLTAKSWRASG